MRVIAWMNMRNGEYHEAQIEYNMTGLLNEIKLAFPDDISPDLSDPKYRGLVYKSPYNPLIAGGLAERLGLTGRALTVELWRDLSNGYCPTAFLPKDSELERFAIDTPRGKMVKLNKNGTHINELGEYVSSDKKEHRIGTEFAFGLGRNTSLALTALELEDPEVEVNMTQEVNRIFTDVIIPEMTKDAMVRTGTDGKDLGYVKELLIASFHHTENRDEEPYKHWHFDVLNTALGEDGKLYSLCNDLILQNKEKYTALFQAELKPYLENKLGLRFQNVYLDEDNENEYLEAGEKNITSYDVCDEFIPASLRDEFSARQKEIDAEMKKQGVSGFLAEEMARKATRDEKTELSPSELKAKWRETFARHGFSAKNVHEHQDFNQHKDPTAPLPDPEKLLDHFFRKHKKIEATEDQLYAHIVKQLLGTHTDDAAKRFANQVVESHCVQMTAKEQAAYFKPLLEDTCTDPVERQQLQIRFGRDVRFTSKKIVEMDKYISTSSKAREHEIGFKLPENAMKMAILDFEKGLSTKGAPFKFVKGQRDAILAATTASGSICNIAGRAGSGKSTLLKVVYEQYVKAGYTPIGTSTSSTATAGLAESTGMKKGDFMNSTELLRQLDSAKLTLTPKHILMVDEAGMMDTTTFYKLIKHANEAGSKLIFTGEKEQLQSIGFGNTYSVLNDQFLTMPVKDINRQRDQWQREMVEDFASGRGAKAMKTLYDEGRVSITKDDAARIQAVTADYIADTKPAKQKIVIAGKNDDVERINASIRAELVKNGTVQAKGATVACKDGVDREFAVGDRIIFTKNQKSDDSKKSKLVNSETGEVVSISRWLSGTPHAVKIRMDDGKEHFLSLKKQHAVKHAYAVTVHKSQGATRESAFWYPDASMNSLHTAYVACSRHRGHLKVYLADAMSDKLVDKMEGKPPTPQMKKVAMWAAKQKGVTLSPDVLDDFKMTRAFLDSHYKKAGGTTTDKPHPMDVFTSLCESLSKTQFKKTSHDFDLADGKAINTYKEIKMEREQKQTLYKQRKQESVRTI